MRAAQFILISLIVLVPPQLAISQESLSYGIAAKPCREISAGREAALDEAWVLGYLTAVHQWGARPLVPEKTSVQIIADFKLMCSKFPNGTLIQTASALATQYGWILPDPGPPPERKM